jgi:hypothetical protein
MEPPGKEGGHESMCKTGSNATHEMPAYERKWDLFPD